MQLDYLNIIGLMTGTSMDGIDISLVKTNGLNLKRLNKNFFYEYSTSIKKELITILKQDINFNLKRKKYLDDFITNEHYLALKDKDILDKCDLIGFHGQTIYHNPQKKISIQLGNPQKLATMLSKNVVFDFRSNDIALGGQGAPLAPVYHQFIIEKLNLKLPFCILNIGGVANLTYWDGKSLIGFDTGPGNALMDDYSLAMFNKNFDKNGNNASKGIPIQNEVEKLLRHDFFQKFSPKSLDRLSFFTFYNDLIKKNYSVYDIMATLAEFTVETIAVGLNLLPKKINNILITGGGHNNVHLMNRLKERLNVNFINAKQLGLQLDYVESELIAYLSARSLYKLPITFPSTTGVKEPSSGGVLYTYL